MKIVEIAIAYTLKKPLAIIYDPMKINRTTISVDLTNSGLSTRPEVIIEVYEYSQ